MKQIFTFFAAILMSCTMSLNAVNYCASSSWGYAGTSVTGGGSATPTLVSSVSELKSAIGGKKPSNKVVIITKNLTFTSMLTMQDASNITILALPGVKLVSTQQDATTSGILFIKRSSNIILRNLTFEGPGAYDCDGNDNLCFEKVTNAWVDHCDFQDGCDGNFDNKSTTDNVTVSWCRFHYLKEPKSGGSGGANDHRFTNLLGSSSSDKPEDGTYNFTWAYCWWDEGCVERMVRCRNAELHFLNCYWNSSVANYYVGPENAKAYFEGCTFEGKANSSSKIFKSYGGTNACKFVNCSGKLPSNSGTVSAPSYAYDKMSAADAKSMVTNSSCGAGATLIVTSSGNVSSSCDGSGPVIYTVIWDATTNGGTCATATSQVEADQAVGTLPTATRSGYTFNGWFTKASGGDKISASTVINGNITFYAQFTENSGGGDDPTPVTSDLTWNFSTSDFNGLGTIDASTTVNGLTIMATSTNPVIVETNSKTIEGISFTHRLKLGGTGNKEYRNMHFNVTGACTIEFYATSSSTQAGNERTLNIYSGSYEGTPISTLSVGLTPAKLSYNYTGGATTIYIGSANSGINFYAINVVYSGEEPPAPTPTYTLTYDENGGNGEMESQTVEEGQSVTVKANAFTAPEGYSFKEWNSNAKGSGTKYNAGQSVTLNKDLTLYAVWQPNMYTVTLDADGGEGGTASVQAVFDEPMPNISIPSRENYSFLGFFAQKNKQGTQYYDANGSSTNSWTIASNTTLYAAWEEQSSETPVVEGDLHFWFINKADAATNNVTNDASFFSNMVEVGSSKSGSITIDGISYVVTKRSGDTQVFGSFTIPTGKKGIFYALAVSSSSTTDRQINLICGENKYEFTVPGGSNFQRIESDTLPAGTYSIEREGSANVRLGVVVVKMVDAEGEEPVTPPTPVMYTVTWNANGGVCATESSSVQENTAVGELPVATKENCTFDGWFTTADGGEQISAETIITQDTTFFAHFTENSSVDPTPSTGSNVIFHWRMSGTDAPANEAELAAQGGVLIIKSQSKLFTVESVAYAANVPDDLKAVDTKGLKNGGSDLHMIAQLTTGEFLTGDTVYICGYNPWKISSSSDLTGDLAANVATGTSKTDYQVGFAILQSNASSLYFSRATGTSTCISAIKVVRPAPSTPTGIENVADANAARKIMRNGQVLIIRDNKTYSIIGTRVE